MKTKPLRPMLAAKVTEADLPSLPYPIFLQPKLDGIRCLITHDGPVSRTLKPIRNRYVQQQLGSKYYGFDGELLIGSSDNFRGTTSGIMSADGEPDFTYFVFDIWNFQQNPFEERYKILESFFPLYPPTNHIHIVPTWTCTNADEVLAMHEVLVGNGEEGTILRLPASPYKHGRSTKNESFLLKFKTYKEESVFIVGIQQLFRNANPAKENALGLTERSTHQDNKIPEEMMGALICCKRGGKETFKVGTGFTEEDRRYIWENKIQFINKKAIIRYFPQGGYDKPRNASFIKWDK